MPEPESPAESASRDTPGNKKRRETVALPPSQPMTELFSPSDTTQADSPTDTVARTRIPSDEFLPEKIEQEKNSSAEPEIHPPSQAWEYIEKKVIVERARAKSAVAQSKTSSSGSSHKRIWVALLVPVALLTAACVLFFVFNSRRSSAEPSEINQVQEPTPINPAQVGSSPTSARESQPVSSPITNEEIANRASVPAREAAPSSTPLPTRSPVATQAAPAQKVAESNIKPPDVPMQPARKEPQPTPTAGLKQQAGRLSVEDHQKQGMDKFNAGNYQEALNEFEKARRLAPGNVDLYYLMGLAYDKMGKYDQALESYRKCTSGVYAPYAQNHVKTLGERIKGKKK